MNEFKILALRVFNPGVQSRLWWIIGEWQKLKENIRRYICSRHFSQRHISVNDDYHGDDSDIDFEEAEEHQASLVKNAALFMNDSSSNWVWARDQID